jgi:hypothetical protein
MVRSRFPDAADPSTTRVALNWVRLTYSMAVVVTPPPATVTLMPLEKFVPPMVTC